MLKQILSFFTVVSLTCTVINASEVVYDEDFEYSYDGDYSNEVNLKWVERSPDKETLDRMLNNVRTVRDSFDYMVAHPKTHHMHALAWALQKDFVEHNASVEVFEAYKFAESKGAGIGGTPGIFFLADFLLRTENYQYIIENIYPEDCSPIFRPVCAYYVTAAEYLETRQCGEWAKEALKLNSKRNLIKRSCGVK